MPVAASSDDGGIFALSGEREQSTPAVPSGCKNRLVGVELVHVLDLTESPPQILYDFHVFERHVQGIGGGVHRINDCLARSFGRDPCLFVGSAR